MYYRMGLDFKLPQQWSLQDQQHVPGPFAATLFNRVFKMASEKHTTETLRETLLQTIESVLSDIVSPKQAAAVASLSAQVIKTAELEMEYSRHLVEMDSEKKNPDQLATGPMLLGHPK